jgi:hypothetical protein
MKKNLLFASMIAASFIFAIPVKAQLARNSNFDGCDRMSSYVLLPDGSCKNLSYLSATNPRPLSKEEELIISKLSAGLAKLGVPISHQDCPPGVLGYYNLISNNMVMCTLATTNPYGYMETLLHESVHVVQDYLDGSYTDSAMTIGSRYPGWSAEVGNGLSNFKKQHVMKNYPIKKQWLFEFEAYYFMQYPDKIIKLLNMCAADPACH